MSLIESDAGFSDDDNGLSLLELWRICCKERWLIAATTVVTTLLSAVYAFASTEWFQADVVSMPSNAKSVPGLAGQLGALGGLASLAGISIGGGGTAEPIAVLKSRDFTGAFITEQNILPIIFADKWDAQTNGWSQKDPKRQPDLRDAIKYFQENIQTVTDDKKTGLVKLSIEWTDPKLAAMWANTLIAQLNNRLRDRALVEADANVKYLRQELAATDVLALQQSIGRLLETELQKLMLARGNKEFAFRVIDRAVVSKTRSRPKRVQVLILGGILGGMLSALVIGVRRSVRRPLVFENHQNVVD